MALQIIQIDVFQGVHVCGFENNWAGHSCFERLFPARDTNAPQIARLEPRETVKREGSTQIVSDLSLVSQKLRCHLAADGMEPFIFRASVATTVAIETRQWVGGTRFELATQHIFRIGHGISIIEVMRN
jgi:hypothetical protein